MIQNLLTTFSIQIALSIILVVFIIKELLATFVLKIWKLIIKGDFEIKNHPMFGTLKLFWIFISIFIAMNIIPFNEKIMIVWNQIAKISIILFITKFLAEVSALCAKYPIYN